VAKKEGMVVIYGRELAAFPRGANRSGEATKKHLRHFRVPKQGADYIVMSLEKYWYLDRGVRSLVKSAAK